MISKIDDAVSAISVIDARIRDAVRISWIAQRKDDRSFNVTENLIHRLVDRALRDLQDDSAESFPVSEKNHY